MPERRIELKAHGKRLHKLQKLFVGKQSLHKSDGFIALYIAAAVGKYDLILKNGSIGKRNNIGAEGYFAVKKLHAAARSLKGRSARIIFPGVITEYGQDRSVASRGNAVWHSLCPAYFAQSAKPVHIGSIRIFKRSFSSKRIYR